VIDISLTDKGFDVEVDWSDSSPIIGKLEPVLLCTQYAGFRGNGSVTEKLVSMRTIVVNVGLFFGSS
jgi:hypothetical protein